jgi:hypothetical protein
MRRGAVVHQKALGKLGVRQAARYPGDKTGRTIPPGTLVCCLPATKSVTFEGTIITFHKLLEGTGWIHDYNKDDPATRLLLTASDDMVNSSSKSDSHYEQTSSQPTPAATRSSKPKQRKRLSEQPYKQVIDETDPFDYGQHARNLAIRGKLRKNKVKKSVVSHARGKKLSKPGEVVLLGDLHTRRNARETVEAERGERKRQRTKTKVTATLLLFHAALHYYCFIPRLLLRWRPNRDWTPCWRRKSRSWRSTTMRLPRRKPGWPRRHIVTATADNQTTITWSSAPLITQHETPLALATGLGM